MTIETKAVLLVGGKGTRLRSVVSSGPKPLAAVGNKSFLELLVRQLRHQGINRIVFCTGYLAEKIEERFGDGRDWNINIEYSKEDLPLGTGGALKLAQGHLDGAHAFIVMNGDSFLEIDLRQFLEFHRERGGFASMAVVRVENAERYGTVRVGSDDQIVGFEEKNGIVAPGLINAGVYVFGPEIFERIPEGPASLERDVFPHVLDNRVYAFQRKAMFIDIGTPEDYARAQVICEQLDDAALR
jgi:NDP-sugar pyrophosphorylase family protein